MEKINRLKVLLNSQEVTALKDDIDFAPCVLEAKDFLDRVGKPNLVNLLSDENKEKLFSLIDKIDDCTKNYLVNNNNSLCLAINHYISEGYDLLFGTIDNFEQKLTAKVDEVHKKIAAVGEELKEKNETFEKVKKYLDSSKEQADKSVKNIDEQLKGAMETVSKWSNTIKQDNEAQITAKRKQIDIDITNYKKEVEDKFKLLLEGFEEFKQGQINAFDKVEEKRANFEKMFKRTQKYAKEDRFDDYSTNEKKTADIFRWLSLGLMLLVIAAVAYLTYETIKTETKTNTNIGVVIFSTLTRFLLIFSLMIPAIYASRESSRHRRNSDKYAQMGNELHAFEIAIGTEDMKPEIKERIKEEIFKRYFGNIFDNPTDRDLGDYIIDGGKIFRPHVKPKDKDER
jgi:hypothetical protein